MVRRADGDAAAALSPLHGVLRRHGATMVVRDGRSVAAHFGSPASETAVCLSTVGIADRCDRTTYELRGAPPEIDLGLAALAPLAGRVWSVRVDPRSAIVRCDRGDSGACSAVLRSTDLAVEISDRFAAIEVIGPRAAELLRAVSVDVPTDDEIAVRLGTDRYELVVAAEGGPALWNRLIRAGASLSVACVGLEALDHLAASQRVARAAGHAIR